MIGSPAPSSSSRPLYAILMGVAALIATACGASDPAPVAAGPDLTTTSAAPDTERASLQAISVTGETLYYDDLLDTDTVLWFWAPW